jgi:recombination protein RecT
MSNENSNGQGVQPGSLIVQRLDQLKVALNEDFVQNQLKASLAENSAAFAASIIDLFTTEKSLQDLNPKLIILQAMKAAILKLPINKSLGFAWIVPYKGVPQFQIGYKGFIQLALRTGQYRIIHADVVYEGEYRQANKLTGEFDLTGEAKSDKVIGYFSHFELLNGFSKTLYMTKEKVTAHAQKYSKSFNNQNSVWKTDFDAMAKKTVVRGLLSHWGYLSVELANAIQTDVDEDAADRVMNEIRGNANMKTTGFDEAEEVATKSKVEDESPF